MSTGYEEHVLPSGRIRTLCHLRLLEGKTPGTFIIRLRTGEPDEDFEMRAWLVKHATIDPDVLDDLLATCVKRISDELISRFPWWEGQRVRP